MLAGRKSEPAKRRKKNRWTSLYPGDIGFWRPDCKSTYVFLQQFTCLELVGASLGNSDLRAGFPFSFGILMYINYIYCCINTPWSPYPACFSGGHLRSFKQPFCQVWILICKNGELQRQVSFVFSLNKTCVIFASKNNLLKELIYILLDRNSKSLT